jgi:hypothetical protein
MREPTVNDTVRLTQDIPYLSLHRGEVGVVRSKWFSPTTVYEVEFHQIGCDSDTRTLCSPEQVEVDEAVAMQVG